VGERRNDLIGTQRENVVFLLFSGDGICLDRRGLFSALMKYWEIIADKLSKAGWSLG
jgi:hypothetical protein